LARRASSELALMVCPARRRAAVSVAILLSPVTLRAKRPSGPNLTLRFAWGFPEALAYASLGDARANEYPIEPNRP
jgi:hypothetical protein